MTQYVFTQLSYPGATSTTGGGINDSSVVVGSYSDAAGKSHAFTDAAGTYMSIDYPNASSTVGYGISQNWLITGTYVDANNHTHGFLDNHGMFLTIDDPAGQTNTSGINSAGTVVGYTQDNGFRYDNGSFTNVSFPGATFSTASGINDADIIVGEYGSNAIHGYVDSGGNYTTLDFPNSSQTIVAAISNNGQLAGTYEDAASRQHGFVDANGVFTTIDFPGALSTNVTGIDDAGDIVGTYLDQNAGSHAFLATIACFVAGARIRVWCDGTEAEMAVEALCIGDLVVTASGARRPIRWLGRRSYGGRFANRNPDVLPVCFKAGSLDDGVPARDLWVSPKHAMFLDGVLVPAEHLVNGTSVTKATRVDRVDYHHVELDSHDVLLAEDAPSESFVDDCGRQIFHNAHEHAALYPDAVRVDAVYCAPRLDEGVQLEAIRRRIDARWKVSRSHHQDAMTANKMPARRAL